jgi:phosphatidylserine decarboxylase
MNILRREQINFLLTNRIPRRMLTRFAGWLSRIEQPLVRDLSLRVWGWFTELDLRDAKKTSFRSVRDCFTRELKDGARPVEMDPNILVSPCDAIVGSSGVVEDGQVLQIKGAAYPLDELLDGPGQAGGFRDGCYVTLRLTSAMYHRFHAPHDCRVVSVTHIPGDTWNVNPAALKRVARLFCENERAVIETILNGTGHLVTLVPVAAILVAGIRLRFLDLAPRSRRPERRRFTCDTRLRKGEEMGWFEHGSTIVLLAPKASTLHEGVREGMTIRAGQSLLRLPAKPNGATQRL